MQVRSKEGKEKVIFRCNIGLHHVYIFYKDEKRLNLRDCSLIGVYSDIIEIIDTCHLGKQGPITLPLP